MTHTNQDETTIIRRQKQEIEILGQQVSQASAKQDTRDRAMNHARVAMDEAIGMATRFASLHVAEGDKAGGKRRSEATRLVAYFKECKRNFEDTLAGSNPAIAEKVSNDESPGDYISQGAVAGSSKQEHAGDSGEAPVGVDNTGSPKKQKAK